MRVLQVSKFFPPVLGGIETVVWELAEGLNRAGVSTDVMCSHHRPRGVHEKAATGYNIWRVGSWGRVLSTSIAPTMAGHLRRLCAGFDVVHVHMPDPMAALAIWAARPKARIVVHWHSDVVRQRLSMRLYEPLQRWVLARADAIVATSQAYADSSPPLRPWLNKVSVVPIGISDNRAEECSRTTQALRARYAGRRVVFALGRMTYYKGFDVLIDAARRLPDDCVVLIGGDGPRLHALRSQVAAMGLADKVHLPGKIHDEHLASHVALCDVFCMSSTVRAEAYGIAMVEAMVMGKPVVGANILGSGVPWVNQNGVTGLNVPPGDCKALADALLTLLGDDAMRKNMGSAARRRYEGNFRAEQMTASMHSLYRRIVSC